MDRPRSRENGVNEVTRRTVSDGREWMKRASVLSPFPTSLTSLASPYVVPEGPARAAQTRWTRKWRKEPTRNRDWEKRAEHNQIRTFILPSWLLPLWPNRLTPRDRGVRWVKGTEHRWNELRPTRQVKREQHEDSLRSCCWPSHVVHRPRARHVSTLPLTSHPVGTREPSGVSPRHEWWTTWGEWVTNGWGGLGAGRWVASRRPVSSRSGMRYGRNSSHCPAVSLRLFPFLTPLSLLTRRRRRYAVRTEWRGDGKEPRHDGRSVERPHPIHIPLLTTPEGPAPPVRRRGCGRDGKVL